MDIITSLTNVCTNNFLNDFRCDYHGTFRKVKNGNYGQKLSTFSYA